MHVYIYIFTCAYIYIYTYLYQMGQCQKSPSSSQAIRDGRVKKGDLLACCGFGAGLTWGGATFRGDGRKTRAEHWYNIRRTGLDGVINQ